MFQSSPGLMAGRYIIFSPKVWPSTTFQSSPGLMAGRYGKSRRRPTAEPKVSILARLNGRALRLLAVHIHRQGALFQSSPGLMAGRYPH